MQNLLSEYTSLQTSLLQATDNHVQNAIALRLQNLANEIWTLS